MPKETSEIDPAGIKLSKKSATPLYIQVYEQFREMILSKRLRPGDRLPASRNLAASLGVSRIIINQGYEQLIMEGYLVGKTGSGTFVADVLPDHLLNAIKTNAAKKITPADRLKVDIKNNDSILGDKIEVIPFQMGTPSLDFFPYKIWHQVGNTVLKKLKAYHLGYEDTLGYWPLRKAIAAYLRISRAVICEAEQVVVVTGSQQGLNLVTEYFLKKGDRVWMEDPGYFGAKNSFSNAGAEICPVPVEEDGLDIDCAIKKFPDAKLAYVTPSHQFPLGYTLSQSKRLELLKWAEEKKSWILEDDYDSEFRYEGRPLPSLQGLDTAGRVIYSGTFSKVLFPGLRLAYIVLPSVELVNELKKVKENLDRQSPAMEQIILTRFMEEGYFLRHIRKMRLLYAERQKILTGLMKEQLGDYFRLSIAPSGMHLLCWISDKIDLAKFKQEIKKQKLSVSFASEYTLQHSIPPAIVLGFTAFSKYKLQTGVEKLAQCVQNSIV